MNESDALGLVLWVVGGAGVVILALIGFAAMLIGKIFTRHQDQADQRDEDFGRSKDRLRDRQGSQGETLASVSARVDGLQSVVDKVADALQRIARLEEWRTLAHARLDEADDTARSVVALTEQNKSIFKRLDVIDDKIEDTPRRTAAEILQHVRPVRAAHG